MKNNLLGIVLPTNSPEVFKKYFLPSLVNAFEVKDFCKILINFQPPWTQSEIFDALVQIKDFGFTVDFIIKNYEVKGPGLVPVNQIREDTARIDPSCKYYMIFDDDMSFMPPSAKMNRSAGEQLLEDLIYLENNNYCGIIVHGGSLIKKIERDTIAPIDIWREYVTGKGLIFRNHDPDNGLLLPNDAYSLLGSDEEKVAAAYRLSYGYYVAEMPFVRINHYENQLSARNKNGKIPGKDKYGWNTDVIKDNGNFGFIRKNYCSDYTPGKGNVIDREKYSKVVMDKDPITYHFGTATKEELVKHLLESLEEV